MNTLIKIFSFLLFLSPLFPQQLYEEQIIPFDGLNSDHFGTAVAVSDSFLFISSLRYSNHIENAVYIYRLENNSYNFEYKIFPSDTQPGIFGMLFGVELLYSGGQLFVGARGRKINNITVGAVYLFEYENYSWIEKQIILPPQPYPFNSFFPSFISKSNDYFLIGADHYDSDFENSGKAFLYKFINNSYELYQEFSPFDEKADQLFGSSGAIDNNIILIGSSYDSTESGNFSGSVYVYIKNDSLWSFHQKYVPMKNSQFLSFGTSLTLNDEYVFIGTAGHPGYNQPGKVYIYKYIEPELHFSQIIETGDGYSNDRFGVRLHSNGDSLLISALFDTVKNEACGAAYLFVNDIRGWKKKYKVYPSDEINTNGFSDAGILTQDKIILGAPSTKVDDIRPGAVFIYSSQPLSVTDYNTSIPEDFFISQNYPNPFNPTTRIDLYIPKEGIIKIKVYDITGREIKTVLEETKYNGHYKVDIDLIGLPTGVYFYRVEYIYEEDYKIYRSVITKKAVFIKYLLLIFFTF